MSTQQIVDAITRAIDASAQKANTTQNSPPPDNSVWWFQCFVVIFTGVLAIVGVFQIILFFSTLKATQKAANAANESASLQKEAMINTQRAFVFLQGMDPSIHLNQDQIPDQFVIRPQIINSGKTPAINSWGFAYRQIFDRTIPDEKIIPNMPTPPVGRNITFIGPSTISNANDIIITPQEALATWKKEIRIFIWLIIEYNDMFANTLLHHTNYCFEVLLTDDPSKPIVNLNRRIDFFRFKTFSKYNSAD